MFPPLAARSDAAPAVRSSAGLAYRSPGTDEHARSVTGNALLGLGYREGLSCNRDGAFTLSVAFVALDIDLRGAAASSR